MLKVDIDIRKGWDIKNKGDKVQENIRISSMIKYFKDKFQDKVLTLI